MLTPNFSNLLSLTACCVNLLHVENESAVALLLVQNWSRLQLLEVRFTFE